MKIHNTIEYIKNMTKSYYAYLLVSIISATLFPISLYIGDFVGAFTWIAGASSMGYLFNIDRLIDKNKNNLISNENL